MSIEALNLAWKTRCPSHAAKLLLVCIADYTDDKGYAWPAITTLARRCDMSPSTVMRNQKLLIESGLLSVERKNGRSNRYRILFKNKCQNDTSSKMTPVSDCNLTSSKMTPDQCHIDSDHCQNDTQTLNKPSEYPEEEPSRAKDSSSSPSSTDRINADLLRKRINLWFRNPASTAWSPQWMHELLNYLSWPEENWDVLGDFMLAKLPANAPDDHPLRFRRRKISAFLENLPDELAKAIAWKATQPGRITPAADPLAAPPCDDWQALADERYQPGVADGLRWLDLDRDVRSELHEFFEKKTSGETAA